MHTDEEKLQDQVSPRISQTSYPVPESCCFSLHSVFSILFNPWLLLLHHQLSVSTIWLLHFLFPLTFFSQRAQHLCGINKLSAFSRKKCNEHWKFENAIYTQTLPSHSSQRWWQHTLYYSWTLARHSEEQHKSQVLQSYGLPNWICNLIG